MSNADQSLEQELFDLICLLISSGRGALEEGVYTASLRLVHAAERLATIAARLPDCHAERRAFLEQTAERLRSGATKSYFRGAEAYQVFMDESVRHVATEIRRDNGL